MADLNRLASMLMELDDEMAACMKCGMCQAVCPVFAETMEEADVTRGKITLLEKLGREILSSPDEVQDKLGRCLLCGSCAVNCPSGVNIMEIFMKARVITATYKGLSPAKKVIFRGLLKHPKAFNLLMDLGAKFQTPFVHRENESLGTASCGVLAPVLGSRHLTVLAKKPFRSDFPFLDIPPGKSGLKAAFFPGCLVDKMFPNIGHAVVKVFKHHGVGIYIPRNQGCCGIPALASGDMNTFLSLVENNLNVFDLEEFDVLVTPCATCTATIKETWHSMTAGTDNKLSQRAKRLSEKTMDISQFLVDKLGIEEFKPEKINKTITYHDPCHLDKSLGISSQPRQVLEKSSMYEFKEMNEANRCCGCGGSFNLYHYDISLKIGQRKQQNIRDSKADIVATSCPACMMQMNDMLSQTGGGVDVKHVIEVYAESLDV